MTEYQTLNSENNSLTFEVLFLFFLFDRSETIAFGEIHSNPLSPFKDLGIKSFRLLLLFEWQKECWDTPKLSECSHTWFGHCNLTLFTPFTPQLKHVQNFFCQSVVKMSQLLLTVVLFGFEILFQPESHFVQHTVNDWLSAVALI